MIYFLWYIYGSLIGTVLYYMTFIFNDICAKFNWFGVVKDHKFGYYYKNPLTYVISAIMLPFINIIFASLYIIRWWNEKKVDNEPK